jgi:methionine sulfoxide reductase heme-binding subunit
MRKLGKKWKSLHKLVFVIIILALIHFFWLVKNVYYVPILYASVVAVLLLLRWKPVRQRASAWQRRMRNRWRKLSAKSRQQSVDEQRIS